MSETMLEEKFSLRGRRALVTGGSEGIGKGIVKALTGAGAEVFVLSRTGSFKENDSVDGDIQHIACDVADFEQLKDAVDQAAGKGLDILVNNAGISLKKKAHEIDPDEWSKVQRVNVDAPFYLSKLAYPLLKKSALPGRIINITSMASHFGFSDVAAYTVSKSALAGLTRALSVEWAGEPILVNSVSPGWIKTSMLSWVANTEREKKILNRMPLHKYGTPDDIASMVLFLVSPAAAYITGQDFAVDGGALTFGY